MEILGIDIGGSGMKAAIVNIETGELITERHRIPTPKPATPDRMADTVYELVNEFNWKGEVGCSFPAVIIDGVAKTAGNISDDWLGVNIDDLFSQHCEGLKFHVGNDADLAGLAEMRFGVGKNLKGKVIMITIGTGLGSGLFYDSKLIPNSELGHIFHIDGQPIENYAADSVRKLDNLSMEEWAGRFDFFLNHVVRIISPNHFIIGGGLSKRFHEFQDYLTVKTPIHVAKSRNHAGIIGAALYAHTLMDSK